MTPELIRGMPMAEYQALPAMSASMAFAMVEECPLRAWTDSPFNPDREPENAPHFDIGTAAHLAVLEPHLLAERIVAHGFDNYTTKAARAARDEAYAACKTPLKPEELDTVQCIAAAIVADPIARDKFRGGISEATLLWEWDGVRCKARPDFLSDAGYLTDLKTAESVNPRSIARKAYGEGWFVRAAWYLAGATAVLGRRPNNYFFVAVEKAVPHIVQVFDFAAPDIIAECESGSGVSRALAWGDQYIGRALDLFKRCQSTGIWPAYSDNIVRLELPSWAEFQLADREQSGEFRRLSPAAVARGNSFLEP